jgi:SNF2 family DNA or RNA helicase
VAPVQWSDDESRQLAQQLRCLERIPACDPPASLTATLRPYQQQGLEWLQFLREFHLAGILADDMGLGKTLQVLAHLLLEKESGRADRPSLVVVPTSLTFNWLHEAHQFAPALKVLLLHGPQRKGRFKQLQRHDLVVTTYPLLIRDAERLKAEKFHLLILDEAQTVKNPKSQASRIVRGLQTRHRLCLTGTPLENHLGELWSLFDFLMPGLLGDEKRFRRDFRTPIETQGDETVGVRLSQRLRPYLLRRTKAQVAKELPEKCEIIQSVALEGAQRELYETVRLSMHRRVRAEIERQGLGRSQIVVLDALLKLRQVCCDPRLVKRDEDSASLESAKLNHLMALLEEMVEEGRRILLFSQFTAMLALIEASLERAGIDYLKLTGQTRDRAKVVSAFQQGEAPLFLISLKAGGVGLNLTAADTVIHYDPWWNPAVERQATDRSHRIGQKQKVFVYKLICEGTLEEKILAMQQRKQDLAEGLYQSGSQDPHWSEEDIEALFGPLAEPEILN